MIRNANTVRLYLKCTYASDLKSTLTGHIKENLYLVTSPRETTKVYPCQQHPSKVAVQDWQRCIRLSFLSGAHSMPIQLLPTPDLMDMPYPTTTFTAFYLSQPPSVSDIVGQSLLDIPECSTAAFATSLEHTDQITIFGDGSVKDGRGAHSTRIYANSEFLPDTPSIESSAITSGDPDTITSLRSKTSSVLSGLYMLHLLTQYYSSVPLEATVTFYYDNCESLRRIDTTIDEFENFADPMSTDDDIWAEMRRICSMLNISTVTEHVKAHQDKNTTDYDDLVPRDAQVNVEWTEQQNTCVRALCLPPCPYLPKQQGCDSPRQRGPH